MNLFVSPKTKGHVERYLTCPSFSVVFIASQQPRKVSGLARNEPVDPRRVIFQARPKYFPSPAVKLCWTCDLVGFFFAKVMTGAMLNDPRRRKEFRKSLAS